MKRNFNMHLYYGRINKELVVNYIYTYVSRNDPENKYPSVRVTDKGSIIIDPAYGLSIAEGFNGNRLWIPGKTWNSFVTLFEKTVNTITKNLHQLYPDIDSTEFEIDSRTMERYQTEQACSTAGFTMIPSIWVDKSQQTYPAIKIISTTNNIVTIPLEDAIPLSSILSKIDPLNYGLQIMTLFGLK